MTAPTAGKRIGNWGEHVALLTPTVRRAGTADYSASLVSLFFANQAVCFRAGYLSFKNKDDISQPPLQSSVVRSLVVKKW